MEEEDSAIVRVTRSQIKRIGSVERDITSQVLTPKKTPGKKITGLTPIIEIRNIDSPVRARKSIRRTSTNEENETVATDIQNLTKENIAKLNELNEPRRITRRSSVSDSNEQSLTPITASKRVTRRSSILTDDSSVASNQPVYRLTRARPMTATEPVLVEENENEVALDNEMSPPKNVSLKPESTPKQIIGVENNNKKLLLSISSESLNKSVSVANSSIEEITDIKNVEESSTEEVLIKSPCKDQSLNKYVQKDDSLNENLHDSKQSNNSKETKSLVDMNNEKESSINQKSINESITNEQLINIDEFKDNNILKVMIKNTPIDIKTPLKHIENIPSSTPNIQKNLSVDKLSDDSVFGVTPIKNNNKKGNSLSLVDRSKSKNELEASEETKFSKSWSQPVSVKADHQDTYIDGFGIQKNAESDDEIIKKKRKNSKNALICDDTDGESSSDNDFICNEAEESNDEDSIDSEERKYLKDNEIEEIGIALGSEDSEEENDDDDESDDSFVVADEEEELLEGIGDDIHDDSNQKKSKNLKKKKILQIVESSEDEEHDDQNKSSETDSEEENDNGDKNDIENKDTDEDDIEDKDKCSDEENNEDNDKKSKTKNKSNISNQKFENTDKEDDKIDENHEDELREVSSDEDTNFIANQYKHILEELNGSNKSTKKYSNTSLKEFTGTKDNSLNTSDNGMEILKLNSSTENENSNIERKIVANLLNDSQNAYFNNSSLEQDRSNSSLNLSKRQRRSSQQFNKILEDTDNENISVLNASTNQSHNKKNRLSKHNIPESDAENVDHYSSPNITVNRSLEISTKKEKSLSKFNEETKNSECVPPVNESIKNSSDINFQNRLSIHENLISTQKHKRLSENQNSINEVKSINVSLSDNLNISKASKKTEKRLSLIFNEKQDNGNSVSMNISVNNKNNSVLNITENNDLNRSAKIRRRQSIHNMENTSKSSNSKSMPINKSDEEKIVNENDGIFKINKKEAKNKKHLNKPEGKNKKVTTAQNNLLNLNENIVDVIKQRCAEILQAKEAAKKILKQQALVFKRESKPKIMKAKQEVKERFMPVKISMDAPIEPPTKKKKRKNTILKADDIQSNENTYVNKITSAINERKKKKNMENLDTKAVVPEFKLFDDSKDLTKKSLKKSNQLNNKFKSKILQDEKNLNIKKRKIEEIVNNLEDVKKQSKKPKLEKLNVSSNFVVEPVTPISKIAKTFKESPITPYNNKFKISPTPPIIAKKAVKRKLNIQEPITLLAKPTWTSISGDFNVSDISSKKNSLSIEAASTDFIITSVESRDNNKKAENSVYNFKENALFNRNIQRIETKQHLKNKNRKIFQKKK